ncbi:hypothetical protein NEOLEDRAFT_1143799 [Neolentinus lepideus HHB14362 ss-1]|uniref:Uncharacterized protein n=1 Tax=Neolentinus lepideus HHB14362 ss-1 TaxID=1314782 RepID=A0A165MBF4_9AGAM|nr:hypothetical protein NEOLEDRAFT_1143799 [Neolentinus lepideus HHB14362 ss-1]
MCKLPSDEAVKNPRDRATTVFVDYLTEVHPHPHLFHINRIHYQRRSASEPEPEPDPPETRT